MKDERLAELVKDMQLKKYLEMKTISNKRVLAIKAYFYDGDVEKSLELIDEGLSLKDKTPNAQEFLTESEHLMWLKEKTEREL